MNWSRAKNILIIMFIALNVFFLWNILFQDNTSSGSEAAFKDTLNVLESRGVLFEENCPVPSVNSKMAMLVLSGGESGSARVAVEAGAITGDADAASFLTRLRKAVSEGEVLLDADKIDVYKFEPADMGKKLQRIISSFKDKDKLSNSFKRFTLDQYIENGENLIFSFIEKYSDRYVFDNYITITFLRNQPVHIEYSIKEINGYNSNRGNILPVWQILLKNFPKTSDDTHNSNSDSDSDSDSNTQPVPIIISYIDLGYKGYAQGSEDQQDVSVSEGPAYRVRMKDGTVRYFKAYTGEEMIVDTLR